MPTFSYEIEGALSNKIDNNTQVGKVEGQGPEEAWGSFKIISLIQFYFQRKGTLVVL